MSKRKYTVAEKKSWEKGFFTGLYARQKKPSVKNELKKTESVKTTPVYDYSNSFSFDKKGRIKGSYNSDGIFEPD